MIEVEKNNQACMEPIELEEQQELLQTLLKLGTKAILFENPAVSEAAYQFLRTLVEQKMISQDVLPMNRQLNRGHICWMLKQYYGLSIPTSMQEDVENTIQEIAKKKQKDLSPEWIYQEFENKYANSNGIFQVTECHFKKVDGIFAEIMIEKNGTGQLVAANGNGRLDAVSNAIKRFFKISYELSVYEEHALSRGSSSKAVSYVGIYCNEKKYWGVGLDEDIIHSSILALTAAVNKLDELRNRIDGDLDARTHSILNYIQEHYTSVTLEELSNEFYLSKPYLSKYIKEKTGKTFGDSVKDIRLKKAKSMLRNGSMKVESIAEAVGYQNVEHFNRLFKKKYGKTPVQFRNEKR